MRDHFYLQQGHILYFINDEEYFIRISGPSIWCIDLHDDITVYNKINCIDNFFIERGFKSDLNLINIRLNVNIMNTVLLDGDRTFNKEVWG